jgi:hypothetical protein
MPNKDIPSKWLVTSQNDYSISIDWERNGDKFFTPSDTERITLRDKIAEVVEIYNKTKSIPSKERL